MKLPLGIGNAILTKTANRGGQRVILVYPFLISLFPVLAMLAVNAGQVPITAGWRIALGSLLLTVCVLIPVQLILRNWMKSTLVTTLILVLIFSYGHVYGVLEKVVLNGFSFGSNQFLLPAYSVLLLCGLWLIFRTPIPDKRFGTLLNIFSLILVAIPLFQLGYFSIMANATRSPTVQAPIQVVNKPDVYYIVLDGYAREDTLKNLYGYDNRSFLNSLKELGFVIPRCAQSNYAWTGLSMASTFQMDYLHAKFKELRSHDSNSLYVALANLIQINPVREVLDAYGYEIIAFENGYFFTEWPDADRYYSFTQGGEYHGLSMFEGFFIRYTTILRSYTSKQTAMLTQIRSGNDLSAPVKYNQVMFTLAKLDDISEEPGPKFVYAHLMSPHSPWVINPLGEVDYQGIFPGYTNEVTYLNSRLFSLVQTILSSADQPPIIIIQSDHGWNWQGRLANLDALYLPDGVSALVTDDWTPVNTFRLIFREYFGLDYPNLPNLSFISPMDARMDISIAPLTCMDD